MNSMLNVAPNKFLFKMVSILAPWPILGFDIVGLSTIYLCFLFLLFDVPFWYKLTTQCKFSNESMVWFFGVLSFCLYCLLISNRPESLVINFCMPAIFTLYVFFGIKKYGVNSYLLGLVAASIFAIFQWTEVTFFTTEYFSVQNIISYFGEVKFGIAQPTGSVTISELITSLHRVSGSTAEPSSLTQMLFLSLPLFSSNPLLLAIILLGIFVSASKVTLILGGVGVTLLILWRLRLGAFALFLAATLIFYFFVGQALLNKFESRKAILDYSPSIYMRFVPVFFYENLPLYSKIFGVGKYGACQLADKTWQEETETKSGYINFEKQENCFMTNFSGVGSLLVDFGMIGILATAMLFTFLPGQKTKSVWKYLLRNKYSILYFWWFLSFLNIYILTFVPASYYFLGWIFSLEKRNA